MPQKFPFPIFAAGLAMMIVGGLLLIGQAENVEKIFARHGSNQPAKPLFSQNEFGPKMTAGPTLPISEIFSTTTAGKDGAVRVPIFVYHSVAPITPDISDEVKMWTVTPEVFEQQLRYLRDSGYTTISFDDLADYFTNSTTSPVKPRPAQPVIISLDDGWHNQYTYAFPLLKKYDMTATFFVFTNAIGINHYLSWDELREMQTAGMAIGNHTMYHPYLFKLTDPNDLRREIADSKKILERNLGRPVDIFAYPFGHASALSIEMLRVFGYRSARTNGYFGGWHTAGDLLILNSFNAKDSLASFVGDLTSGR